MPVMEDLQQKGTSKAPATAVQDDRETPSLPVTDEACGKFAGQLQILGFSKLRRHLGPNWPKYKSKIHIAVENIISTNLGPRDMSSRVGQDHYILIFDEKTSTDDAERISLNIARKIREVFVGESSSDLIEVKSQVGQVKQTDMNDIIFAPIQERPAKLAGKDDAIERKAAPASAATAEPAAKEKPAATQDDLASSMMAMSQVEAKRRSLYEVEYVPFWNIHNEVLTGYAVTAVSRRGNGPPILEHNVLRAGASTEDIIKLDTHLLKTQIEVAAELYQNDFTSLLISQVHFDTLSNAHGREEVLKIARQIPASLKPILMIEIVGIPDHTPPSTVSQRAAGLNTMFRALTVRVPRLDFSMSDCVAMGATAVAYKFPPKYNAATLMQAVKKFTDGAKAARLMTTFEYVPNVDVAAALKDANAIFVSGAFLGGPFDTPGNMKKLTIRQVRQGPISPY